MSDVLFGILAGWSAGFAACSLYFHLSKLIRSREEHYLALNGFSDHCRRIEVCLAIDELIQENRDKDNIVRMLQDLQTRI